MRYQCPSHFFFQIALIYVKSINFVAFNQGTTKKIKMLEKLFILKKKYVYLNYNDGRYTTKLFPT